MVLLLFLHHFRSLLTAHIQVLSVRITPVAAAASMGACHNPLNALLA